MSVLLMIYDKKITTNITLKIKLCCLIPNRNILYLVTIIIFNDYILFLCMKYEHD